VSDSARDLLVRGIAAAKGGEAKEARFFLEWVLRTDAAEDQRIEACLWLCDLTEGAPEKRRWLEEVLALRPAEARARRKLALLTGELNPGDVVDPDALPPAAQATGEAETLRVDCPSCGAALVAVAGSRLLSCTYCGANVASGAAEKRARTMRGGPPTRRAGARRRAPATDPAVRSLAVELARLRGHRPPGAALHITCQGCSAVFLLPAESASLRCPYCQAVHVVDPQDTVSRMAPDALLPAQVDQESAAGILKEWLAQERLVASPLPEEGIYLPFWTFEIAGEITSQQVREDPEQRGRVESLSHRLTVRRSLCVPATRRQQALLTLVSRVTAPAAAVPFDAMLLAGWPAETYQVPLSQAAIEARGEAVQWARSEHSGWFRGRDTYDTSGLIVEDFGLLLIPLWIGAVQRGPSRLAVCVHGVTGEVFAD
jgi:LSD1 subclass zinc finger protein